MKHRRQIVIVTGFILSLFSGYFVIGTFNDICFPFAQMDCYIVSIVIPTVVLSAYGLTEGFYQKRVRAVKQKISTNSDEDEEKHSKIMWFLVRPVGQAVLATVMLSLPLVVQNTLVVTFFGALLGFSLCTLFHGIRGRLIVSSK